MTAETIFVGEIRAYFNTCRTLEATEVLAYVHRLPANQLYLVISLLLLKSFP